MSAAKGPLIRLILNPKPSTLNVEKNDLDLVVHKAYLIFLTATWRLGFRAYSGISGLGCRVSG